MDRSVPTRERKTILVDGFNVLHAVLLGSDREAGWWRQAHRERLLDRVAGWRGGPDEIWVAFDGPRPATSVWAEPVAMTSFSKRAHASSAHAPSAHASSSHDSPAHAPGHSSRHSAGPIVHSLFVESADDWIVRRARRTLRPEETIVVSADRKVAGRARSAGCEILSPWAFVARCPEELVGGEAAGDEVGLDEIG